MAPGTEFARDFFAGIGPLQLGVVLVFLRFENDIIDRSCSLYGKKGH